MEKTISRKGFTLLEMLVVLGIIAALVAASLASFNAAVAKAQTAKARELVLEVRTALLQVYQKDDSWPKLLRTEGASGNGQLTPEVGGVLAKRGALSLTYETHNVDGTTTYRLSGINRFGIVSPWAEDVIKKRAKAGGLSLSTRVPTGGTIEDHRLRFAIDDDDDGKVKVSGEAYSATVRGTACVWSAGRDGKFGTKDDIKSWTVGEEVR